MTTRMTLRLPDTLTTRLDAITAKEAISRHALILSILNNATRPEDRLAPDLVLGFIPLTGGELADADCPECTQLMQQPHIGFTAGMHRPQIFGPVCALCAQTS